MQKVKTFLYPLTLGGYEKVFTDADQDIRNLGNVEIFEISDQLLPKTLYTNLTLERRVRYKESSEEVTIELDPKYQQLLIPFREWLRKAQGRRIRTQTYNAFENWALEWEAQSSHNKLMRLGHVVTLTPQKLKRNKGVEKGAMNELNSYLQTLGEFSVGMRLPLEVQAYFRG